MGAKTPSGPLVRKFEEGRGRTGMPRKKDLTPKDLFEWASGYARSSEASGFGTKYPTLRMAARRYGRSQAEIEELLDEGTEEGYLGLAVGVRTASGTGTIDVRGDCLVEAYA
jgi:hypothetical protein